ncbi:MAG: bifunctional metallophosphatase/5'-nucleotidase [Clostridia bacterium]|nr:bifunctional metallophosphatase/5'-nucleotidase [Clostridia bacterium]
MKLDPPKRSGTAVVAVIVAVVVLISAIVLFADFRPHGRFTLTVLFTGDLHGNMELMPKYQTLINSEQRKGETILLDCGDLYQGGSRQDKGGIPESLVLSSMKYDAMTLGNNEFWCPENSAEVCDENISALANNATFDILCANVEKNGEYLQGVKPYTIIDKRGLKIAIIGLTTNEMDNKEVQNKTLRDPVRVLNEVNNELAGKADIKIVLSHCETEHNMAFSGVDAIVAGHIHQPTDVPVINNNGIPMVRAGGENKSELGKLVLELVEMEDGSWRVDSYTFELLNARDAIADQKISAIVAGLDG